MKLSSARIVDPVLTELALGYVNPEFVGSVLFPVVTVPARAGKVPQFGRDRLKPVDGTRAPGSATKRITIKYSDQTFSLIDESLDAQVPREELEEASAVPSIDLQAEAVEDVQALTDLNLEIKQAELARDAALYPASNKATLTSGNRINDAIDPAPLFTAAHSAIRKGVGKRPNVAIIPSDVMDALKNNAKVREQMVFGPNIKPVATNITDEMLANYIGVEKVYEAAAVTVDDDDVATDVWGKDIILAWVNPRVTSQRSPNYGFTFRRRNYPIVEKTVWDSNTKSWINGYTDSRQAKITMIEAGYIIKSAID